MNRHGGVASERDDHHDDFDEVLFDEKYRVPRSTGRRRFNVRRTLRRMATSALGIVLAANGLAAQDHVRYREFQLGTDVATVAQLPASLRRKSRSSISVRPRFRN